MQMNIRAQESSRLYICIDVGTFTSNPYPEGPGISEADFGRSGLIYRCWGSSWLVGTRSHRSGPIRTLLWAKSTPERGSFLSKDESEFWLRTALSSNSVILKAKDSLCSDWLDIIADEHGESLNLSGNLSDRIEIASETLKMHKKILPLGEKDFYTNTQLCTQDLA